MKVLLGIIFFHVLVIVRAKMQDDEDLPIISTAVLTLVMAGYVILMMYTMEEPQP